MYHDTRYTVFKNRLSTTLNPAPNSHRTFPPLALRTTPKIRKWTPTPTRRMSGQKGAAADGESPGREKSGKHSQAGKSDERLDGWSGYVFKLSFYSLTCLLLCGKFGPSRHLKISFFSFIVNYRAPLIGGPKVARMPQTS